MQDGTERDGPYAATQRKARRGPIEPVEWESVPMAVSFRRKA